ncbi:MAG: CoA transferase [Litoreibacter sp.]
MQVFEEQIANGLGRELRSDISVKETDPAEFKSWFSVSDLAVASISAAASETAAILGKSSVSISRKRTLKWFETSIRPIGWTLPPSWDSIAGDYKTVDGWIRLHTNAPHHRAAALSVLACKGDRETVAATVSTWKKTDLETTVVASDGCAAAMHTLDEWAAHPQGQALANEPLIHWDDTGFIGKSVELDGLRVLDLTRVLAGPIATRFLAGFGASVLRIDPPSWNEPSLEPEITLGKRCTGLDLKNADDRLTFEDLLRQADVLVHGYRPGALNNLGYTSEQLRTLSPGLIDVSLNAYGHSGPWAERRGFDSLVQMSCGIAAEGMLRANSDYPTPLPVQALDHATGYLMAAAVLRALRIRNRDGRSVSAKLSLARTAALLISAGVSETKQQIPAETPSDFSTELEKTGWGDANRIAFPASIDGSAPIWRHPSRPLRTAKASW